VLWPQAAHALLGEDVTRRVQITRKFTQLREEIVRTGDDAASTATPEQAEDVGVPVVRGDEILF
jgi:hypothetical protein